jgi:hypothetical protein
MLRATGHARAWKPWTRSASSRFVLRYWQPVVNGDPLDHEHAVTVEYLADRLDLVPLRIDFDLTRLQRAGESAGQSAARRGDDIVEHRGVRREPVRIDAVVLGHERSGSEDGGACNRAGRSEKPAPGKVVL